MTLMTLISISGFYILTHFSNPNIPISLITLITLITLYIIWPGIYDSEGNFYYFDELDYNPNNPNNPDSFNDPNSPNNPEQEIQGSGIGELKKRQNDNMIYGTYIM